MAYGLYNPSETYYKPKFWLAKPNKQIITRLKEIDTKSSLKVMFGQVNEVSFTIPYYKEKDNQTIINPSIEMINAKYLLKMEFMDNVEWFVIEKFSKEVGENDTIPATAYSLQYELSFKKIYEIEETSVLPDVIIKQVLDKTGWKVGTIDSILAKKYRSYTFSNTSTLDCLYQIAEICNGILQFDTVAQTVSLYDEKTLSKFNGLILNDKNYLNTLTDAKSASEIVTRLYPIGNEGITINSENPSGTSYLEDFSYFLYPFKRDPITKETISSSLYFSDELSHATLDYQDIIKEKSPEIKEKTTRRDAINLEITGLETDLAAKQSKLDQINDITDIMKTNREFIAKSVGNTEQTLDLRGGHQFVQFRALAGTATITFNGVAYNATTEWTTFKKDFNVDTKVKLKITGATDKVQFYVARISTEENTTGVQADIIAKYNAFPIIDSINELKKSLTSKDVQLKAVATELSYIHDLISVASNFSDELIKERDRYIFEEYWVEDNHVNPKELYEDALEQFKKINKPSTTMNIDIINFLNMVGEVRNWLKLTIGSKLRVMYEKLNIRSESILIGIDYDFENNSINLTVSDTSDLMTDEERLVKMIYASSSSSNYLALKKFIYDDAVNKSNAVQQLLDETWDANLRRIVAGVDESVEISKRGIIIRNPMYPDHILVAQAGVIAISDDNGMSFKNALTTEGLIAERILGQVIIGERVWIEDDNGIVTIKGDQIEIKDNYSDPRVTMGQYEAGKYGIKVENGALEIVGGLKKNQLSPEALLAMEGSLSDKIGGFTTDLIAFRARVSETFKDAIISEEDRAIINIGIANINTEKSILDAKYNTLYNNPNLPINDKDLLYLSKINLGEPMGIDPRHSKLIELLQSVILDNAITQFEADDVSTAFVRYLEALALFAQRAEQSEKSIVDSGVKQLRTDLRMTAPLPTSIKIDENGFTAYQTDVTKFARMDYRGLYVQGGAIDIRTASAANRGVVFDGNGLRGYNSAGVKTFDLETDGDFTMTGGTFRSIGGDSSMWITGGSMELLNNSGTTLSMSPTGFYGRNANNSIRFQADESMVTSAALGTSNANVYLGSINETRSVHFDSLPGDGLVDSYLYTPVRASGFYGNFWNINSAVDGIHLYARPLTDGELRVTLNGTTDQYRDLRSRGVMTNFVDSNSLHGQSRHLYLRPLSDGEIRATLSGTVENYIPIRASGYFGTHIDTTSTHMYVRPAGDPGEVRVTVRGGTDVYQPIRVSAVRANILEINNLSGVSSNMYIGVGSGGETRNVIVGTTDTFAPIRASGFIEASSEDYKDDITEWDYDALSVIMNEWQAYQYKFKGDELHMYRRGSIVERKTPVEFINGKGINTYEMNTWNLRAVQQLGIKDLEKERQILELQDRVAKLEAASQLSAIE